MKLEEIKKNVEKCKTAKQVRDFLNKNGIKFTESWVNESDPKSKRLNINLNEFIRIYWSKFDGYIVQEYTKHTEVPNGKKKVIPICYGYYKEVNDYDTIITKNTQNDF